MLYMFLAATVPAARTGAAGGRGGMSAGAASAAMTLSLPALAFVFAFILVGYAVWDLDQLSGRRYSTGARVSLAGEARVGVAPAVIGLLGIGPTGVGSARVPGPASAEAPAGQPRGALSATRARATVDVPVGCHADRAADDRADAARTGGSDGARRIGGAAGFLLSPAVTVGCRIAMGVTMAFMLLIAL
jgi:hypothetical protein